MQLVIEGDTYRNKMHKGAIKQKTSSGLFWLFTSHNIINGELVYKENEGGSSGSKIVKCLRSQQYDQVIIERITGIVLGHSSVLHRHFLKLCTLPNKAKGTIWRVLFKLQQRRQGADSRLLWLLFGTLLALGSSLPHLWLVSWSIPYSDWLITVTWWHGLLLSHVTVKFIPGFRASSISCCLCPYKILSSVG